MSRVSDFQKSNQKVPGKIEKLDDVSLGNVSGGISEYAGEWLMETGNMVMVGGLVGTLGCSIARMFCMKKVSQAMQRDDKEGIEKYSKIAKGLEIASASCAAAGVGGALSNKIVAHMDWK